MIKIVVICDEEDDKMGVYFQRCAEDLLRVLKGLQYDLNIQEVNSRNLNITYLDIAIGQIQGDRFLFFAYSHGHKHCLRAKEAYIEKGYTQQYANSLFYTFSCHAGAELGLDLIENGCLTFFGYTSEASFIVAYIDLFVDCANHGFKRMAEGLTARQAFLSMQENYNHSIDVLYRTNYLAATVLAENRDALVLHGNEALTIQDFIL